MSTTKAAVFMAFMFALAVAQDRISQAALKDLPLPWILATLHFGAGMLWVFPAWVSAVQAEVKFHGKCILLRIVLYVAYDLLMLSCCVSPNKSFSWGGERGERLLTCVS